jgi:glycosyltransferase involved in cell wall biosynthesis
MKVLHILKVKGIGGAERHLLTLLPALHSEGVETGLLVLTAEDVQVFLDETDSLGIPTSTIEARADVRPMLPRKIASEIRASSPDLVHTHLLHGDVYGQLGARLARVPAVSSIHSVRSFYGKEPVRSAARTAGRLARRTIAISSHVADNINKHKLTPADRVRVVHYGVDTDAWANDDVDRASARDGFGLDREAFVVGLASNLIPGKGHDVMLESFGLLRAASARTHLLVAGTGPLDEELRQRASSMGLDRDVTWTGYVPDMKAFMAACDVVVFPTLPSLGEGFGLAALEAMASGRPVVASDMGPLPEIVVDGVTGFLVAPGAADEIARALEKLEADRGLLSTMGATGRTRAKTEFGSDAMAERTVQVYREALE